MNHRYVFTGPTLNQAEVQSLVPGVEVFPPVASGDLLRLPLQAGDIVAIIDGFYFQSAAVRHKEILDLLHRGIQVWGAASMGALRAAELAPFGMRGIGRIFQAYVKGDIDGDDEVAVLHAPKDMAYANLSEALVNIRYACQCALSAEVISPAECEILLAVAQQLPFYERSYPHILQQAIKRGLAQQQADAFENFARQKWLNLKRADALELLQALATASHERSEALFEFNETSFISNWRISERRTFVDSQHALSDIDLLTAYQLFGDDYPQTHAALLLQLLAEIAVRRAPCALLPTEEGQLQTEDVLRTRVAQYMSAEYGLSMNEDEPLPPVAQCWLRAHEAALPRPQQLVCLAVRLWHGPRCVEWQAAILEYLKGSSLLASLTEIVLQTYAFNKVLHGQHKQAERVSVKEVTEWFIQRWHVPEQELELVLLERGFAGFPDFLERALPFYLLDRQDRITLSR